jgi:hypothetical protein
MSDDLDLRYIKPFEHNGKQIPALHDLQRNAHKLAIPFLPWLFFKPDKFRFNLIDYSGWVQKFKAINYNGTGSRAWAYLIQGTSGVFAQGTKKLSFQPCIFATAEFTINRVQVVRTFYYRGTEWAEIKTLNVHDAPPPPSTILDLTSQGLAHRYVAIGKKGQLYPAPKDHGNVYVLILSNGTPLYIETEKLIKIV